MVLQIMHSTHTTLSVPVFSMISAEIALFMENIILRVSVLINNPLILAIRLVYTGVI